MCVPFLFISIPKIKCNKQSILDMEKLSKTVK